MLRVPPSAPKKPLSSAWKAAFLDELTEVCQDFETVPLPKPYKKAVLRHYNYDLSKRWYVEYYAWHEERDCLVRFRLFQPMNREKSMHKRIDIGEQLVRIINGKLYAGQYVRANGPVDPMRPRVKSMSVRECMEMFIAAKRDQGCRETYLHRYRTLVNNWEEWRQHARERDFYIIYLNEIHLRQFFDWLTGTKQIAARSFNNYRSDMSVFLNYMEENYPRAVKKKLLKQVTTKRVPRTTRHAAFTDAQVAQVADTCRAMGYTQLLLMIYMVYYTLARPRELMQLRVSDIDMEQDRILIPGHVSKNWDAHYVHMPPALKREIQRQRIKEFAGNLLIFGQHQQPGERNPYGNSFWERNVRVLKRLGFTERRYDLYSYKHSGAISLYRATKDIKLVQVACRHSDINQTANYLRDLGIVDEDYFKLDSWQGALQ